MRAWLPYLLSLTMPAGGLVYLVTAPHSWAAPAIALAALVMLVSFDEVRPAAGRPQAPREGWAFDLVLVAAAGIHFAAMALLGLPRHADHHVHPSRAYQQLGPTDASPKLPYGYLRMVMLVLLHGEKARRLMTAELERKRLGPFHVPG